MAERSVLAVGTFNAAEQALLLSTARETGLKLQLVRTKAEAGAELAHGGHVGMLVEGSSDAAGDVCLEARSQADQAHKPILTLVRDMTELSFVEAFSWGADDVIDMRHPESLLVRLRNLPEHVEAPTAGTRGVAVIADSDRARRVTLARVLRSAGYEIRFAVSEEDAASFATGSSVAILSEHLCPEPHELIRKSPATTVNWLVTAAPKHISAHQAKLAQFPNVRVADAFAPPENLVFVANEMLSTGGTNMRAAPRLLYGTKVCFRGAGRERDDYGYSYNVSTDGLYVRTLAPPAQDRVWLELRPPRTDRLVRLEGEIVWRRRFGPAGKATVPPGFGVKITDGSQACGAQWRSGCDSLAKLLA